jgi:hypothetical protein
VCVTLCVCVCVCVCVEAQLIAFHCSPKITTDQAPYWYAVGQTTEDSPPLTLRCLQWPLRGTSHQRYSPPFEFPLCCARCLDLALIRSLECERAHASNRPISSLSPMLAPAHTYTHTLSLSLSLSLSQNFGHVEEGLYRSGQPNDLNFPFLEKLQLKYVAVHFLDHSPCTLVVWVN